MFKLQSLYLEHFKNTALNLCSISACVLTTASLCLMVGCASTSLQKTDSGSTPSGEPAANFELIGQIQLPPGSKIVNERTLILGAGDAWVGRITMEIGRDTNDVYQFFMEQYPKQGWGLISASRGSNSLIVFLRQDRTATIEIRDGTLAATPTVILTVAPKSNTPNTASPAMTPPPNSR